MSNLNPDYAEDILSVWRGEIDGPELGDEFDAIIDAAIDMENAGELSAFPEGYQGAGPMFAAIEVGDYLEADRPVHLVATGFEEYTAFLDRSDAEAVAPPGFEVLSLPAGTPVYDYEVQAS